MAWIFNGVYIPDDDIYPSDEKGNKNYTIMEQLTFEEGMKLSFRINDLKREVADFLEKNFDQSGALPVFMAEQELYSVVSKAVHKQFTALVKENPKFLHKAKEMGMSDKAIKSICEDLKAEGVTFEPVE